MQVKLRMSGKQHDSLRRHLLREDGAEAVAFALCGKHRGKRVHVLLVQEVHLVPDSDFVVRAPDHIQWKTHVLERLLARAAEQRLSLVKFHSHPGGWEHFSSLDDDSDRSVFGAYFAWVEELEPQASVIMLPEGRMMGRAVMPDLSFAPLASIAVAGEDFHLWRVGAGERPLPEFVLRHRQLFGEGTTALLRELSVAIVGCSGTGSPLVEQLFRLGVGRLVLVDPQAAEHRNLNRIVHATREHAERGELKVEVLRDAIYAADLGTKVVVVPEPLASRAAIEAVASCDVVFGCVDGLEGRHLLNRLAAYYVMPYIDVGVHIDADGFGGVAEVCLAVHYLEPDGTTLLGRGAYTMELLDAEVLLRTNPAEYEKRRLEGYVHGVQVDRPAVVSLNFLASAYAVNELLARVHPFRARSSRECSWRYFSLTNEWMELRRVEEKASEFLTCLGLGDVKPALGLPALELAMEAESSPVRAPLGAKLGPRDFETDGHLRHPQP